MAFVSSLQRKHPPCCQIDTKGLLYFLFVIALVLLYILCFSFVSEGHILSNSSTLKWGDAFTGRSFPCEEIVPLQSWVSFFMPLLVFVLHGDFLPLDITGGHCDVYFVSIPLSQLYWDRLFLSVVFMWRRGLVIEKVHHIPLNKQM